MFAPIEIRRITAEESQQLPDDCRLTELVRERVAEMNRPFTSRCSFCGQVAFLLTQRVKQSVAYDA